MKLESLKPKQQKAILHLVDNPTVSSVAKKIGISEAQIWNWLRDSAFREVLDNERDIVFEQAMARLKIASTKASDTLVSLLDSQDERIQLKASSDLLDRCFKFREVVEFEKRISALEEDKQQR